MEYQQLKIDIKTKDGITERMYHAICKTIHDHGGAVMDDAQAPYTESLEAYYSEQELDMNRVEWERVHNKKEISHG